MLSMMKKNDWVKVSLKFLNVEYGTNINYVEIGREQSPFSLCVKPSLHVMHVVYG
jgi:hypothetical protein